MALHRADRQPERPCGLGLGEVVEVAQRDHCALPRGQRPDRLPDLVKLVDPERRVVDRPGRHLVRGRLPTPRRSPPPRHRGIGDRPPDVRLGGLRVADPAPRQVHLGQRGLEEILGVAAVAGQRVRRAEQRGPSGSHERRELGVGGPVAGALLQRHAPEDARWKVNGLRGALGAGQGGNDGVVRGIDRVEDLGVGDRAADGRACSIRSDRCRQITMASAG